MIAKGIVVMCTKCGTSIAAYWDDPKQVRLLCQGCGETVSVPKDPAYTGYSTATDKEEK